MQKKSYEDVMAFLCDYGLILLVIIAIGLVLYFTRSYWLPLLGLG